MPRTSSVTPTSFNLAVVLTTGTSARRNTVTFKNRNTKEYRTARSENNSCAMDLANLSSNGTDQGTFSGFSTGDVIEINVTGGSFGMTTFTIPSTASKGGTKVTIATTDTTSTNTPGATL